MRKLCLTVWVLGVVLRAQTIASGPQVLTFHSDVDDSDQPYAIYVPRNYSGTEKWPLVVSLHAEDSTHRLDLRRVFGRGIRGGDPRTDLAEAFPQFDDVGFIVVSPLARGSMGYQGIAEKDVYDVLDNVRQRFSIDEDRIYLTGISAGGGGALRLALTRPDLWAAVAPVCPNLTTGLPGALTRNALDLPVRLFQGELDPLVPAARTRQLHQELLDAGAKSEYIEYKGVRHNAWDYAYKDRSIFEWFGRFRRRNRPGRVRFSSAGYQHASAWWLRMDRLTPGTLATADAELAGTRLTVRTGNLDGFSLIPERMPGRPVLVQIDGASIRIRPRTPLSFRRTDQGWLSGPVRFETGSKRPGAEGPVLAAISARHVYIYGTDGAPSPAELLERRQEATRAANWSSTGNRLLLKFRVLSDREATESDLAGASLVLFGTKETNTRIAAVASRLPLHLNPGAADYGLVYVYPLDGRYVVISSGLPWWTRQDQSTRPGLSVRSAPWQALQGFGDFIVFRGGLEHVVAEGRFDNQWRLAPDIAATLRATGALEIAGK